jgi:predicted  nucleic acid-binding Zn-ribbon protein
MAEELVSRVDRLEDALAYVGTSLARLAEAQMKTEERFKDIEERFLDLERHSRETDERIEKLGRETDARIEKLVIAIGEFLRNGKNKQ